MPIGGSEKVSELPPAHPLYLQPPCHSQGVEKTTHPTPLARCFRGQWRSVEKRTNILSNAQRKSDRKVSQKRL